MDQSVQDSVDELEKSIMLVENENVEYLDLDIDEVLDTHDKKTLRDKSLYYQHFHRIYTEATTNCPETGPLNNYYAPDMIDMLLKNYMALFPLWSGIMLPGEETRDTNSAAELWMRIVKREILQNKGRQRATMVLRKLHTSIAGRLNELSIKKLQ